MHRIRFIMALVAAGLMCQCTSAGTSSSADDDTAESSASAALTITSVKSGTEELTAAATKALATTPAAFTVIFSAALDPTTVSPTTVTLACEGAETLTVAEVADADATTTTDDDEYTITPSATLPEMDTCTLTFGTGVTVASSLAAKATALAEAVAYTFTTPCASGSSFRNDFRLEGSITGDDSCFTASTGSKVTSAISATATEGTLALTFPAGSVSASEQEFNGFTRSISGTNLQLDLVISGIADQGATSTTLGDGLIVGFVNSVTSPTAIVDCGTRVPNETGGMRMTAGGGEDTNFQTEIIGSGTSLATLNSGNPVYMRLVKTGDSFDCSYRLTDSGDYSTINTTAMTASLGSTYSLIVSLVHSTTNDAYVMTLDSLTITETE